VNDDLDFDELDKAVNSLMGGVTDKDATPKAKTLDINSTLAPDEAPTYKNLGHAAEGIGSEAIDRQEKTVSLNDEPKEPKAAPKAKRGGRFMDVVHPSSDMKQAKVSHQGATIAQPIPSLKADPVDTTAGNLPLSEDPLAEVEPEDIVAPPPSEAEETPEPQTSPFLPDAKVEKRPLGSPEASKADGSEKDDEPQEETTPAPVEEKPMEVDVTPKEDESSKMDAMTEPAQNLTEVTEHVPEEYQDELLAVEKGMHDSEEEALAHVPVIASIPKQYQEKPSTGESKSGSIYDTDHYHKPLAHPAKQKSGWLWVIVILILVLIGAGMGAAVYFFGLV
jgi:hypothetical protein